VEALSLPSKSDRVPSKLPRAGPNVLMREPTLQLRVSTPLYCEHMFGYPCLVGLGEPMAATSTDLPLPVEAVWELSDVGTTSQQMTEASGP